MEPIYQVYEKHHGVKVLTLENHPDRAVIRAYNHMENLVFFPFSVYADGSNALREDSINDPATIDFVMKYSYPVETANRIAAEITED